MANTVEGRLWVKVVSGHDLAIKDITGKSDPYCVMIVKNQEKKHEQLQKTTVIEKDLNPVWEEEFTFDIYNKKGEFYLEMYDEDLIGSDDFMGQVSFSVFPEFDDEETKEKTMTLLKDTGKHKKDKVKGDVKLKIHYTSLSGMNDETVISYLRLRDRLLRSDMKLVEALLNCSNEKKDEVARVAVSAFLSKGDAAKLVRWAVVAEVAKTVQDTTLFRTDSHATRLMKQLCRIVGMDYVKKALGPVVESLGVKPEQYEVDPSKNKDGESNIANLTRAAEDCLNRIINSLNDVPIQLRLAGKSLYDEVNKKFSDKRRIAVAGFFFLRFLAPAIFTPQQWGLLENQTISGPHQRALILLSKVIQNLANDAEFGQKEAFMSPMNRFVVSNRDRFQKYIDEFASPKTVDEFGVVLAEYQPGVGGDARNKIPLQIGDVITIQKKSDSGWWWGISSTTGKSGYFPSTYIQSNQCNGGITASQDDRSLARDMKFIHRHLISESNATKAAPYVGLSPANLKGVYDISPFLSLLK